MRQSYDVVVVGGGAAGLSGAVALGRSRRSVLVVDAGRPRNAPAEGVHNLLGREGIAPADLYAAGRAELAEYGGDVVSGEVVSATRTADGFSVTLSDGREACARRLLLTTGLVDELPDVPGVRERWGRDVLHCPYCHGYEVRDQPVGVLATSPLSVHQAHLFRQLTNDVVVFTHTGPPLSAEHREELDARGVRVVEGEVAGLESGPDGLSGVRLVSGQVVARRVLVVAPRFLAGSALAEQLGLETTDVRVGDHVVGRHVVTGQGGTTSAPGVWAAGNVTELQAQVVGAAAAGLMAGAHLNADLVAEDVRLAVAARRQAA